MVCCSLSTNCTLLTVLMLLTGCQEHIEPAKTPTPANKLHKHKLESILCQYSCSDIALRCWPVCLCRCSLTPLAPLAASAVKHITISADGDGFTAPPRSRALATVVTVNDRTGMLSTMMFTTCYLPPKQMTTVFAGLRRRRLELSHVDTSATERENRSTTYVYT